MKTRMIAPIAALALAGCAGSMQSPAALETTMVLFRSVHGSDVTVAVGCGDLEQEILGVVESRGTREFEIPPEMVRCVWGLRFWLIPQGHRRAYLIDPVAVRAGDRVDIWIEKYPGLSVWRSAAPPRL